MRRLLLALAGALVLAVPAAQGASPDVLISQVYAGGGNTGAAYANDYVELFNRGSTAVDLSGWTVQYATAAGTSWSATPLAGSIGAGRHYLVQLATSGAVGAALPAPDATGTTNLANTGGKVALVHDTAALTCGASAGSCSAVGVVHDLLGYGTATDYEGTAAAALSATTSATRTNACTDTDANGTDFDTVAPQPHNLQSAVVSCGTAPPVGVSTAATVDVDVQSVLSLSLERQAITFGSVTAGQTPAPVGEHVTVVSTGATGYTLSVHRTAFAPADLPLGLGSTAPAGGQLGPALAGGAIVAVPITPAVDLLIGTTAAASAVGGDVWPTSVGFASPIPVVPPGHYTSSITYTVIAR